MRSSREGKQYLSTKEIAAAIRTELKEILPKAKFSVSFNSFSGGSSIDVRLMAGVLPALEGGQTQAQINEYMLADRGAADPYRNNGCTLTPWGLYILRKAVEVVEKYHWDESEPQVDYFSCNFYLHLAVGKWDRGYQVTK